MATRPGVSQPLASQLHTTLYAVLIYINRKYGTWQVFILFLSFYVIMTIL
ncbi:hypothetical protein LPICM17_60021 [Lactococcus piscium]|nr:hypothetical protein LPICM17_60021 [Lactococcus piscium]